MVAVDGPPAGTSLGSLWENNCFILGKKIIPKTSTAMEAMMIALVLLFIKTKTNYLLYPQSCTKNSFKNTHYYRRKGAIDVLFSFFIA